MPNKRIQELMKAKNIKPIKLPKRQHKIIKLDGIDDPRLPKQIAQELAGRNDVREIVYHIYGDDETKREYQVNLNSSDGFYTCLFYTVIYQSCL